MNSDPRSPSLSPLQFSLTMLILATLAVATVLGLVLKWQEESRLRAEVRVLEVQESMYDQPPSISTAPHKQILFEADFRWVVFLPPGESYRLRCKSYAPQQSESQPAERAIDQSFLISPGQREVSFNVATNSSAASGFEIEIDGRRITSQITNYKLGTHEIHTVRSEESPNNLLDELLLLDSANSAAETQLPYLRIWIEKTN